MSGRASSRRRRSRPGATPSRACCPRGPRSGASWTSAVAPGASPACSPPPSSATAAPRAPGRSTSQWSCSCSGGRDVRRRPEVARRDAPLDLGISEVDGDAERVEPVHALELVQLEILHLAGQVAEVLEVLDVAAVLVGLGALGIDDGDLPGLRHALARALDQSLVDPLLHDLVADVVG